MLVLVMAVSLLMVNGICDRKTVLTHGLPAIIGTVIHHTGIGEQVRTEAAVSVDGTRLLPVVAVNDETLHLDGYSSSGEYMWDSEWSLELQHLAQGSTCVLNVYQFNGNAVTDSHVLALDPEFSYPPDTTVLRRGDSLKVRWKTTSGVDRYELYFDIWYRYSRSSNFYLDTTVILDDSAGSYTLPAGVIFPSHVDSVKYGHIDIDVTAEAGPDLGRQTGGNIKGNGCGYFWTRNSVSLRIDIGADTLGLDAMPAFHERLTPQQVLERKRALLENR